MYFRKDYKKLDKEITRANRLKEKECEDCIIDVKLQHGEEIFSKYNYENLTTLNEDFSDYLWRNEKLSPASKPLTIKIHAMEELKRVEVTKAIKNYYKEEYMEVKNEIKKTNAFSLATLIIGILFLGLLFIFHQFVNVEIVNIIIEIIAWVFIWESVDSFFLKRSKLLQQGRRIQRLYTAKVEIIEKSKF